MELPVFRLWVAAYVNPNFRERITAKKTPPVAGLVRFTKRSVTKVCLRSVLGLERVELLQQRHNVVNESMLATRVRKAPRRRALSPVVSIPSCCTTAIPDGRVERFVCHRPESSLLVSGVVSIGCVRLISRDMSHLPLTAIHYCNNPVAILGGECAGRAE